MQRFLTYIRELCNELRANVFAYGSFKFVLSPLHGCSGDSTAVLKALKETRPWNVWIFSMLFKRHYTKKFALVAAE
jgi:hypothetical protein